MQSTHDSPRSSGNCLRKNAEADHASQFNQDFLLRMGADSADFFSISVYPCSSVVELNFSAVLK